MRLCYNSCFFNYSVHANNGAVMSNKIQNIVRLGLDNGFVARLGQKEKLANSYL